MGFFSSIGDLFGRLGGKEYAKQQIEDAAKFGIIAKDLLGDRLSIRDVVKIPKVVMAALKFVSEHGRPNEQNVAAALADEGLLDAPTPDQPPPPPII